MIPTEIKESVKQEKCLVTHEFPVLDSQYKSMLLVRPNNIDRIRDIDKDVLLQKKLCAENVKTLQDCNTHNFRQFIVLDPISVQQKDAVLKSKNKQHSLSSGSLSLEELWRKLIKTASDFLKDCSTMEVDDTKNDPCCSNSVSKALCIQRHDELQKILGKIREFVVPVYFENHTVVKGVTLNAKVVTANLLSGIRENNVHVQEAQEAETTWSQRNDILKPKLKRRATDTAANISKWQKQVCELFQR